MQLTFVNYAKKGKTLLVCIQSAVTRHKMLMLRDKLDDKIEFIRHDPIVNRPVVYKEVKKIRTVDKKSE
jgi:hypothetical protein